MNSYDFEYDATGTSPNNLVEDYPIVLNNTGHRAFALVGPFFGESIVVRSKNDPSKILKEHKDYRFLYIHSHLFGTVDGAVYSIIYFFNKDNVGEYYVDMQLLGGNRQGNASIIQQMILNIENNSADVYLENIIDFPTVLPPEGHLHNISDTYGYENAIDTIRQLLAYLRAADNDLGLSISNQINGINDKYNTLVELISDLESGSSENAGIIAERLSQIEQTLTELADQVNNFNSALEQLENDLTERVNTLDSNVSSMSDSIGSIRNEVTQFKNQITTSIAALQKSIEDTNERIDIVHNKQATLEQTITGLATQLTQSNQTISQQGLEITSLKERVTVLENTSGIKSYVLTGATQIGKQISRHLALHAGPHTLPSLADVEIGHTVVIGHSPGTYPNVRVKNTSTEQLQFGASKDTSITIEDVFEMTFTKISNTLWLVTV